MSGLVSRWATDEGLVKEAEVQDKKAGSSPRKSKQVESTKIDTSEKTKPLVSRWANENVKEDQTPVTSTHRSSHKRHNVHNKKKHHHEADHIRDGESQANKKNEGDEEKLVPMTDAAKSFAARLGGLSLNDTGKKTEVATPKANTPKGPRGQIRKQSGKPKGPRNNDDGWEHVHEHEDGHEGATEDEILPPMSKAGQTLASRLGLMQPANGSTHPAGAVSSENKTKKTISKSIQKDTKYLTPRQKKLQEEKEAKERKEKERQRKKKILDEEEKIKQEKLKQEVSEMFDKLTDKHANWADIEDDEF